MERALVVTVLIASLFGYAAPNAGPEVEAVLDGMETLCGERYAGSLDGENPGSVNCIRAYAAHCASKNGGQLRERQALAQLCATVPECPYCSASETAAQRCIIQFKRYKQAHGAVAEINRNCERILVDGVAHPGVPDVDVGEALMRDTRSRGQTPNCADSHQRRMNLRYCMCREREQARPMLGKEEQGWASRNEWEEAYRIALDQAKAAGCDLVLTR